MENTKIIATDERAYSRQVAENETFANKVNKVLDALKKELPTLTDAQVSLFVSDAEALKAELCGKARDEYSAYVRTLPESVRGNFEFKCRAVEVIDSLHDQLPPKTDYTLKTNATTIENGRCVLTEDGRKRLREAYSVSGDDALARVWELATDVCGDLNELDGLLRGSGLEPIESWGRWLGLIIEDPQNKDARFAGDIGRLKMIAK